MISNMLKDTDKRMIIDIWKAKIDEPTKSEADKIAEDLINIIKNEISSSSVLVKYTRSCLPNSEIIYLLRRVANKTSKSMHEQITVESVFHDL